MTKSILFSLLLSMATIIFCADGADGAETVILEKSKKESSLKDFTQKEAIIYALDLQERAYHLQTEALFYKDAKAALSAAYDFENGARAARHHDALFPITGNWYERAATMYDYANKLNGGDGRSERGTQCRKSALPYLTRIGIEAWEKEEKILKLNRKLLNHMAS